VTFKEHFLERLGPDKRPAALLMAFFSRPFTADTLAGFWRYWNPLYGYYLTKLVYGPLRRFGAPRALAVVTTFLASGFLLHDVFGWPVMLVLKHRFCLPPVTTWFFLLALCALAGERFGLSLKTLPSVVRVLVHLGVLAGTGWLALLLVRVSRVTLP
jgi:hypothetical protein